MDELQAARRRVSDRQADAHHVHELEDELCQEEDEDVPREEEDEERLRVAPGHGIGRIVASERREFKDDLACLTPGVAACSLRKRR